MISKYVLDRCHINNVYGIILGEILSISKDFENGCISEAHFQNFITANEESFWHFENV